MSSQVEGRDHIQEYWQSKLDVVESELDEILIDDLSTPRVHLDATVLTTKRQLIYEFILSLDPEYEGYL